MNIYEVSSKSCDNDFFFPMNSVHMQLISASELPLRQQCRKLCHSYRETEVKGVEVNGSCPYSHL